MTAYDRKLECIMDNMAELYFVVVYLAIYAFMLLYIAIKAIPESILFARAGQAWWKAFIPFYGWFIAHKIAFGEKNKYFWFLNLVTYGFYDSYQRFVFVRSFGKSVGFAIFSIFFPLISDIIMIVQGCQYTGPQNHFMASKEV